MIIEVDMYYTSLEFYKSLGKNEPNSQTELQMMNGIYDARLDV